MRFVIIWSRPPSSGFGRRASDLMVEVGDLGMESCDGEMVYSNWWGVVVVV